MVRHSEERLAWLPNINKQVQQHDAEVATEVQKDNYFVAPYFYCEETICVHVVLWLLGPYMTSQNLPQRFLTGRMLCIQYQICDQTILLKPAWPFILLSALALKMFGKRHLAL